MKNRNILAVQNLLRCLDIESLRNSDVVANLVRAFGLVSWGTHPSGPETAFITQDEAAIAQTPDQIAKALVYLSKFMINSFCEVGVMHGGNLLFCSEYLRRFNPTIQCLGVDPTKDLSDEIRDIIESETFLSFKSVTSNEISGQVFDLVFIDADHTTAWVTKDYENVGKYAKFCMFHDLQDPTWGADISRFWKQLKNTSNKVMIEFLDDPSGLMTHGIGIMHDRGIS